MFQMWYVYLFTYIIVAYRRYFQNYIIIFFLIHFVVKYYYKL